MLNNIKNQKPDIVIFDWDNTLVRAWGQIYNSLMITFDAMNKPRWTEEKAKLKLQKSMRHSFKDLFPEDPLKAQKIYRKASFDQYHNINLLPNAMLTLDVLHKHNIPILIVSNKGSELLRKEIDNLKITDRFLSIVGAGDAEDDKPSADPALHSLLMAGLKVENNHIWFIGDTVTDMCCAYNANCIPVLFGEDPGCINQVMQSNYKPMLHIKTHQDLSELFEDILI